MAMALIQPTGTPSPSQARCTAKPSLSCVVPCSPGGLTTRPSRIPVRRKAAAALLSSSSSTALQAPTHSYAALCTKQSTPDSAVPTALVEEGSNAAPAPTPLPVSPAPCLETPVSGSRAPSVEQLLGEGLRPQVQPRGWQGNMAHAGASISGLPPPAVLLCSAHPASPPPAPCCAPTGSSSPSVLRPERGHRHRTRTCHGCVPNPRATARRSRSRQQRCIRCHARGWGPPCSAPRPRGIFT